jgi:hypothetical protein
MDGEVKKGSNWRVTMTIYPAGQSNDISDYHPFIFLFTPLIILPHIQD